MYPMEVLSELEIRELEMRRSVQRDLDQKLSADKRERDDARDRVEYLVRQFNKDNGVAREAI